VSAVSGTGTRYDLGYVRGLAEAYLRSSCRITAGDGWTPGGGGGWNPEPASIDVACAIQPITQLGATGEVPEGGVAGAIAHWRIYLPAGTPCDAQSVITWLDADPTPRVFRVVRVDGEQTAEPVRRAFCVERT
jgi:hypothetical protein